MEISLVMISSFAHEARFLCKYFMDREIEILYIIHIMKAY